MTPDHGFHPLRVARVVPETHDSASLVFDVPPDLVDAFRYRAGQFCTFRVPVGDDALLRCYSMSSAPETDAELTLTVKRVAGGRVSNWLLDEVGEGDLLELTLPAGVFTLRERTTPIVAFAAGSGITPVISVLKSALASTTRSARLLYANRDAESVHLPRRARRVGGGVPGAARGGAPPRHRARLRPLGSGVRVRGRRRRGRLLHLRSGPVHGRGRGRARARPVPVEQVFIERFAFAASPPRRPAGAGRREGERRRRAAREGRHRARRTRAPGALPAGRDPARDRPAGRPARAVLAARRGAARRAWRGCRRARRRCG